MQTSQIQITINADHSVTTVDQVTTDAFPTHAAALDFAQRMARIVGGTVNDDATSPVEYGIYDLYEREIMDRTFDSLRDAQTRCDELNADADVNFWRPQYWAADVDRYSVERLEMHPVSA